MSDVNLSNAVKVPHTPLIDRASLHVSREWLYFFDNVGKVVDETIQANLSEMTKKILDGAGNIASLQGDTQAIQDEIADIKRKNATRKAVVDNAFMAVNNRMDLLSARVASNESAISNLQNTLSSVQSSLQDLQTQVGDLQTQVTSVNDRLVVVEGKLP